MGLLRRLHVWGRPVGVAVARDGALLMTEDGNGTIWRIAYQRPKLSASIVEASGQKYLLITVSRAASTPNTNYTVEVSTDMRTWAASPDFVSLSESPTQLVLRDNIPTEDRMTRFIRLRTP
jgi:hypothetical protein